MEEENQTTKLKGKAYPRKTYLMKTKHPLRWKIRQLLKKILSKIDKENSDLYDLD